MMTYRSESNVIWDVVADVNHLLGVGENQSEPVQGSKDVNFASLQLLLQK